MHGALLAQRAQQQRGPDNWFLTEGRSVLGRCCTVHATRSDSPWFRGPHPGAALRLKSPHPMPALAWHKPLHTSTGSHIKLPRSCFHAFLHTTSPFTFQTSLVVVLSSS